MSGSKEIIARVFGMLGLEIRRKGPVQQRSFVDALKQARELGLSPATVFDVGAAYGTFTLKCHSVFPQSRYILIEPLNEYQEYLEKVCKRMPRAEYVLVAAAGKRGQITINVHPDFVGSSVYLESEVSDVNGIPRTVPAETLDQLRVDMNTVGRYLIKIDVQGAELEVLSGAGGTLSEAEYVILEVSLFEFFRGGPQLPDVVQYMKSRGFSVYDIFDFQFRPLDKALSQVDMAFVRDNGQFRKHHFYATPEQRKEQTKLLLALKEK